MGIAPDLRQFALDLIQNLLELRKTLLGPKAPATCCMVLIECLLDLNILLGLAEFKLGLTIHNKAR